MQNKKDNKNTKPNRKKPAEFETFALAGGKKNPKTGTTIPPEEGVIAAEKFVEENKK